MNYLTEVDISSHQEILPNGLTVVTIEMPHIHTVELAVFVRAGLRFENEENNGISHFLEHMMFRGNAKFKDSILLNREFEKIGRDFRASTLSESTYYGFTPHISQVERAVKLFADFFCEPTFPEIEIERGIIREEYLEDLNEEGENIDINNQACALMYGGTPLAMPTIGTEKTIAAINEDMLREYFRTYYIPANMVLTAAGPLTHESFLDLAKKYFSDLNNSGHPVSRNHFLGSIVEDQKKPQTLFLTDSDSQVQLQICFRAVSANHPDYFAVNLISRMFDDGVTSRLQKILREGRGLVYSVECRATTLSDVGTIDFDVTVSSDKVCEVAQIILNEIREFTATGPDEEELNHFKQRVIYDLDSDLDDPYKQILRHAFSLLYSRVISVEEEWGIVQGITREDVLNIAKKIFVPEKLNMVLIGPHTPALRGELEKLMEAF